jgi:transposase-like protein
MTTMAILMTRCPVCKKNTPHTTVGTQRDTDDAGRKYQKMTCTDCNTSNKVYTGERGEEFQENVDLPDNTDLSDAKESGT